MFTNSRHLINVILLILDLKKNSSINSTTFLFFLKKIQLFGGHSLDGQRALCPRPQGTEEMPGKEGTSSKGCIFPYNPKDALRDPPSPAPSLIRNIQTEGTWYGAWKSLEFM